jgi:hypothetical protein
MAFLLFFLSIAWAESAISQAGLSVENVDYVIADFTTGQVVEEHWREPQTASPGSLLKPFTALAYGRKNGLVFPELNCTGETCWLRSGHGQVGIVQAIAHSCNAYFRQLVPAQSVNATPVLSRSARTRQPQSRQVVSGSRAQPRNSL